MIMYDNVFNITMIYIFHDNVSNITIKLIYKSIDNYD